MVVVVTILFISGAWVEPANDIQTRQIGALLGNIIRKIDTLEIQIPSTSESWESLNKEISGIEKIHHLKVFLNECEELPSQLFLLVQKSESLELINAGSENLKEIFTAMEDMKGVSRGEMDVTDWEDVLPYLGHLRHLKTIKLNLDGYRLPNAKTKTETVYVPLENGRAHKVQVILKGNQSVLEEAEKGIANFMFLFLERNGDFQNSFLAAGNDDDY